MSKYKKFIKFTLLALSSLTTFHANAWNTWQYTAYWHGSAGYNNNIQGDPVPQNEVTLYAPSNYNNCGYTFLSLYAPIYYYDAFELSIPETPSGGISTATTYDWASHTENSWEVICIDGTFHDYNWWLLQFEN